MKKRFKSTDPLILAFASLPVLVAAPAASQAAPTPDEINAAGFKGGALPEPQSALTAKVQILLDRAGISPGVIDGYGGENVAKALRAFEEVNGFSVDGQLDEEVWDALQAHSGDPMMTYEITEDDVSRIVEPLPEDYEKLAERDWLGYTSAAEKLAEKFHMDIEFFKAINSQSDFSAGTSIQVADVGENAKTEVARIVADKSLSRLLAYDSADDLVLSYPVTIGSDENPSPKGEHDVEAVAIEPTYTYRPDENFQQGDNAEQLTLPPGPNGPVGIVWIDLSEPTYGLHGSPDPAEISKTASHGCVRMTNWDARELADLVDVGIPVTFKN